MDTTLTSTPQLATLAKRLDCFTEDDLVLLTDASPITIKQWRKRGEGPAYILAGNRYLYPCDAVAEWMRTRIRERKAPEARAML